MPDTPPILRASANAFDLFHGHALTFITVPSLVADVRDHLGEEAVLLVASEDGAIRTQEEPPGAPVPHLVTGASVGLAGVIAEAGYEPFVKRLHGLLHEVGSDHAPVIVWISAHQRARDLSVELSRMLAELSRGLMSTLASREQMLVAIRKDLEAASDRLQQYQARTGHLSRARYVGVWLAPGERTLGPDGCTVTAAEVGVRLPVGAEGLASLRLFVASAPKGGRLGVALLRSGDGRTLTSGHIAVAAGAWGWQDWTLDTPLSQGGELDLVITWEDCDAALALADQPAERFGMARGTLNEAPALQLVLTPYIEGAGHPEGRSAIRPVEMRDRFQFVGGEEARQESANRLGGAPISYSAEEGWLQTHPLPAEGEGAPHLTAVALPLEALAGSAQGGTVRAVVALDHPHATDSEAGLAIAPRAVIEAGQSALQAFLADTPQSVVTKQLAAHSVTGLTLAFEKDAGSLCLVLYARSLVAKPQYGRLRWHRLDVIRRQPALQMDAAGPAAHRAQTKRVAVPVSILDLADGLQFVGGDAALARIRSEHNIQALKLFRGSDAMQIHPVRGRPSAAYVPAFLPPGVLSVSFQAVTLHEAAPDFLYGLVALPVNHRDPEERLGALMDRIIAKNETGHSLLDQSEDDGVFWSAMRVSNDPAGRTLPLNLPGDAARRTLALITAAVTDSTAFGWCNFRGGVMMFADEAAAGAN